MWHSSVLRQRWTNALRRLERRTAMRCDCRLHNVSPACGSHGCDLIALTIHRSNNHLRSTCRWNAVIVLDILSGSLTLITTFARRFTVNLRVQSELYAMEATMKQILQALSLAL